MSQRKLFAIGDIHGCLKELLEALNWIESQAPHGAEVVFLGDHVDRGEQSREVIEVLMRGPRRPQDLWEPIMGNHEAMMLKAIDNRRMGDIHIWLVNGGDETLISYGVKDFDDLPADHIEWIRSLPLFHETESHWFVHGGLYPDTHPEDESPETLLWARKWWKDFVPGSYERHVVFGHTPFKDGPKLLPHCTGLDTAACFGYSLTAAEFDRYSISGPIRWASVDVKGGLVLVKEPITL